MAYVFKFKLRYLLGFAFLAIAGTAHAATLQLSSSSQNLTIGDTVTVNVLLDTQGQAIDGVDLHYINYNPYFLQLQNAQVTPGTLMPNTLINSVDSTNGKIDFSQITSPGSTYKGSGTLATMTFKALVAGNTSLTLDFTPGATTDSNVASQGTDILSSVTNANFTISYPTVVTGGTTGTSTPPTPPRTQGGSNGGMKLVKDSTGTYWLILYSDNMRHGITSPGILYSYGFEFKDALTATAADMALPVGDILLPGDGALVKDSADPTVWLISGGQKHGFSSASVFGSLGFKFSNVLLVTTPELNKQTVGSIVSDPKSAHLPGLDILDKGTVYWVGYDNLEHGYPSIQVYNSWHIDNDFTKVVPANAADLAKIQGHGDLVQIRIFQ